MSMTRGPIVPPSTGSSTDFPVSLSVNVTVPVTMLLPSIDPPLSLCPRAVAEFRQENRLLGRDWQTRVSACRREIYGICDPAKSLFTPQYPHHLEDPRRGGRAGQGGAQRLRHRSELCPVFGGELADASFENIPLPRGAI